MDPNTNPIIDVIRRWKYRGAQPLHTYVEREPKTVRDVADKCLQRASVISWPESIAAQLAVEFFLGAAVGAATAGDVLLANQLGRAAMTTVSKRGMAGVKELSERSFFL